MVPPDPELDCERCPQYSEQCSPEANVVQPHASVPVPPGTVTCPVPPAKWSSSTLATRDRQSTSPQYDAGWSRRPPRRLCSGTLLAGAVLRLPDLLGLTGLDDRKLLAIVRSLPRTSERRDAACELLVARYRALVGSCVLRYRSGPESADDLMQVGYVGLMKAINNFDPTLGCPLAAYAEPYITGEIKRHFRDRRWHIHVTRAVKDIATEIRAATPKLAQDLGRTPSGPDLARHLRISDDEL